MHRFFLAIVATLAMLAAPPPALAAELLRPWKGGPTPALVLATPGGVSTDLATLRGKVVLVNFWATWCAPCVEEMPALAALRERFAARGFEVLAVNHGEGPERVSAFMARTGVDLRVLLDRDKLVGRAWKVRALPTTFIVDARGHVRGMAEGEIDTGAPLVAAIEALLPGERPSSAAR